MMRFVILVILSAKIAIRSNYFEYREDCDVDCVSSNLPCVIAEPVHDVFTKVCVESSQLCEQQSSRTKVCLRPNSLPMGGQDIWPDYRDRFHPVTTISPLPAPDEHGWRTISLTQLGITACGFIILISYKLFKKIATSNEVQHEPLLNESPEPESGLIEPNPYQPTVSNV